MKYLIKVMAALTIVLMLGSSRAEGYNFSNETVALQAYFQSTYGISNPGLSVVGENEAACPQGYVCLTSWILAVYTNGDAAGEALMFACDRSPNCRQVVAAGGGVFSDSDLESLGVSPAQAQQLTGS